MTKKTMHRTKLISFFSFLNTIKFNQEIYKNESPIGKLRLESSEWHAKDEEHLNLCSSTNCNNSIL